MCDGNHLFGDGFKMIVHQSTTMSVYGVCQVAGQELFCETLRQGDVKDDRRVAGLVVDITGGGVHENHLTVRPYAVACSREES
jgi:hypothetical protein